MPNIHEYTRICKLYTTIHGYTRICRLYTNIHEYVHYNYTNPALIHTSYLALFPGAEVCKWRQVVGRQVRDLGAEGQN